jgi:hypothetical protein
VPGLAGLAFRLDEQHRLHGLDVGADEPRQRVHHRRVGQRLVHQRRQLVGEVDAEVLADDALVGLAGGRLPDAVDGAELAPADACRLVTQGLHLVGGQRIREDGVAVAVVVVLGHGASVRWRRRR